MPSIEAVNDVMFWVLAFLLLWNAYILLFHGGVPNIGTAPAIQRRIVEVLQKDAAQRLAGTPYIVVDLGSGEGGLTRRIARGLPAARVVGLEISPQSYHWARLRLRLSGLSNLEYRKQDFFSADLSAADAVVFYQSVFHMHRLGRKLHDELRAGTIVISNKFHLGDGWQLADSFEVKTLYLHQGAVRVYKR